MRCETCAKTRQKAREREWQSSPEARAYRKRYYHAHRVEQKARHAAWLKTPRGRECVIAQRKRFYTAHPEKMAEYAARKWAKHGERYCAERREEYRRNPAKFKAYQMAARERFRAINGAPMPPLGEAFNARLYENALYAAAIAAVPRGYEDFKREDIASDVVFMIIAGLTTLDKVPDAVKRATREYNRMYDRYKTVSIDAPIYAGSTRTIGDNLSYPTA
jgi:hypothetical protein